MISLILNEEKVIGSRIQRSEKFPPFCPSLPNPKYLNWMQLQLDKKTPEPEYFDYLGSQPCYWEIRLQEVGKKVHLRKSLIPMLQPCPYVSVLTGHEVIIWGWRAFLPNSFLILCGSRRCLPIQSIIACLCCLIYGLITTTAVFQADSTCIQVQDLCSFLSFFFF